MRAQLIIFLVAGFLSYLLERQTKSLCKDTFLTHIISLLHNYGSIYLIFGSLLFGHHLLHLCVLFFTVSLWYVLEDGMCPVTSYYNNLCKISPTRPFHDVFYLANQYLNIPYFREIMALSAIIYNCNHIWKN